MDDCKATIRLDNDAATWRARKRVHDRFDFSVAMNGRCDRLHFE